MNEFFSIDSQVRTLSAGVEEVFETGAVGIHLMAADGTILRANDAELGLLGYAREEYEGRPLGEFCIDREAASDLLARLKRGGKLERYPVCLKARDGSVKYVEITASGRYRDGEFVLAHCFTVDVTELKRAELSSAHLAAIVTSSNDAIVSKTLAGIVTSWNAAAERIFGYAAEEMIGQSILRLIPADRYKEEEEILARLRAGERIEHYETVRQTKDGRSLDVSLSISPIRDSAGQIIGASKIAHDISERKRADRTRELLIKELHHRIKNTLANVQALAQHTLRRSATPDEFVVGFSGRLQALARAHSLLTNECWQGIDLKTLILDQLQASPDGGDRLSVGGPELKLEPEMALHLAMLLNELYANAMKHGAFTMAEGKVDVSWRVKDRVLELRWREQGGPVVCVQAKRGFGTVLIEQSAKGYNGVAHMSCETHGVSWDISFELPRSTRNTEAFMLGDAHGLRGRSEAARRSDAMNNGLAGKRVLVVEDEPLIALEQAASLEDLGLEPVGPAGSIEEALRLIAALPLDAALLDGNLSGHPVDEVAAALTRRGVPFAFVTGYGRSSLPQAFQNSPMIAKPCTHAVLLETMQRLLLANDRHIVPLRGKPAH